ncbi:hypothetical protein FRB99_004966 [Tulasnella sp. 403]|nr:hypothetical protein FRB99_004966 [Tulasnella sp. 403]
MKKLFRSKKPTVTQSNTIVINKPCANSSSFPLPPDMDEDGISSRHEKSLDAHMETTAALASPSAIDLRGDPRRTSTADSSPLSLKQRFRPKSSQALSTPSNPPISVEYQNVQPPDLGPHPSRPPRVSDDWEWVVQGAGQPISVPKTIPALESPAHLTSPDGVVDTETLHRVSPGTQQRQETKSSAPPPLLDTPPPHAMQHRSGQSNAETSGGLFRQNDATHELSSLTPPTGISQETSPPQLLSSSSGISHQRHSLPSQNGNTADTRPKSPALHIPQQSSATVLGIALTAEPAETSVASVAHMQAPPPASTSGAPSVGSAQLRLQVDSTSLPGSPPNLPGLSLTTPSGPIPDKDPQLPPLITSPGTFRTLPSAHSRGVTLPSASPSSPSAVRRLANASTPGVYLLPMADSSMPGSPVFTMKMTPSLVVTRPAMAPMCFPSLLVSGVSTGETENTSPVTRARSNTEDGSGLRAPPTMPRRMRSAMPALRRDGSLFYMDMPGATPTNAEQSRSQDMESTDDEDEIDDEAVAEMDPTRASDDDSEEAAPATRTALLGGMAKGLRAMRLPVRGGNSSPGSVKMTPTPTATSVQPSSPSYFRPRPSDQVTTPTPLDNRPRSGSGSSSVSTHRLSLVVSGAPGLGLSTVSDDHDGELADKPSTSISRMRNAPSSSPKPLPKGKSNLVVAHADSPQSSPTSHQEFHTPALTPVSTEPPGANRGTIYFDADDGGCASSHTQGLSMLEGASASAFTTASTHSAGEMSLNDTITPARPAITHSTISTTTIRPPGTGHGQHNRGGSGSSEESALGLDLVPSDDTPPPTANMTRATRSSSSASKTQRPTSPPSSFSRGRSSTSARDYFASHAGASLEPFSDVTSPAVGNNVDVRLSPHVPVGMSPPRTPGGRPMLYNQVSHSMLDFSSLAMEPPKVAPLGEVPSGKGKSKGVESVARKKSSGPRGHRSPKMPMSRRRSLPDMSGLKAPPPPYPKFTTREDEGKEMLPPYACRVHFEASVLRKMEFNSPGLLARDRSWKRVYVVLNGTSLWVYKQDPRQYMVKPAHARIGPRATAKDYPAGGRKGDGIVGVYDVVIGAPHVHLPEDVLQAAQPCYSLRATSSRSSSGSGGMAGVGSSPSRRSLDASSTRASRRSSDLSGRRGHTSRSSLSSSSHLAPSTNATSPANASSIDLAMVAEESEKRAPTRNAKTVSSILGATRPTNSQTLHPHAGSHLLASLQNNVVLRQYSLQNAETGLASDYHKRKNVIRVRADGEQFLIQVDNVLMAVDWIETFQAGANVALDLDERPMPKVPAFPRRNTNAQPEGEPTVTVRVDVAEEEPRQSRGEGSSNPSRFSFSRRRDP